MKELFIIAIAITVLTLRLGQPASGNDLCIYRTCGPTLGAFTLVCGAICALGNFSSSQCIRDSPGDSYAQCLCVGSGNAELLLTAACDTLREAACLTCDFLQSSCSVPINSENSAQCNCQDPI